MSEFMVTIFLNSDDKLQIVTDGSEATCPQCGYPERHRIYDGEQLIADGCPSCETSRIPVPQLCGPCDAMLPMDCTCTHPSEPDPS